MLIALRIGYHNNPKANGESFTEDGFYRTGDIAQIDKKTGKMYIVDRKKELIKVRAFQVAPPESGLTFCVYSGGPHGRCRYLKENMYQSKAFF